MRMAADIPNAHSGSGVNLLKVDGSAAWRAVDDGEYADALRLITSQGSSQNSLWEDVWAEFDK